jgi:Fur family ferric uptake transcriptional regulator
MTCEKDTIRTLREAGHKMTPQRILILSVLRHGGGHMSASEIHAKVREVFPYVDISTVYRTLNILKERRLVTETDMGTGDGTYEWAQGEERHHHLICRKCGRVSELDHRHLEQLAASVEASTGFRADVDHFAIFGLCPRCR